MRKQRQGVWRLEGKTPRIFTALELKELNGTVPRSLATPLIYFFNDAVSSSNKRASNQKWSKKRLMNGRSGRGLIWDTISTFAWRNWGKTRKTSVRIAGFWPEIWTWDLLKGNRRANHCHVFFSAQWQHRFQFHNTQTADHLIQYHIVLQITEPFIFIFLKLTPAK
jgi:hypothetical protein